MLYYTTFSHCFVKASTRHCEEADSHRLTKQSKSLNSEIAELVQSGDEGSSRELLLAMTEKRALARTPLPLYKLYELYNFMNYKSLLISSNFFLTSLFTLLGTLIFTLT